MTAREAARFLADRRGQQTCVHFELRPDGSIIYRGEAPGLAAPALAAALAACAPHGPPQELAIEVIETVPAVQPVMVLPEQPTPASHRDPLVDLAEDTAAPCAPDQPDATRRARPTPKKPKKPKKSELVIDGFYE